MTYREELKGNVIEKGICPKCGFGAGGISVEDDGWDDDWEHYIEYSVFKCSECSYETKFRAVYTETNWIEGWGEEEEE